MNSSYQIYSTLCSLVFETAVVFSASVLIFLCVYIFNSLNQLTNREFIKQWAAKIGNRRTPIEQDTGFNN